MNFHLGSYRSRNRLNYCWYESWGISCFPFRKVQRSCWQRERFYEKVESCNVPHIFPHCPVRPVSYPPHPLSLALGPVPASPTQFLPPQGEPHKRPPGPCGHSTRYTISTTWFLCFLYLSIHSGQCGPSPYGTAHFLFSYFLVVSLAFSWVGCSSSHAH